MVSDTQVSGHISKRFDSELEEVHSSVLRMGGLVETQVNNGIKALLESDSSIAEHVAGSDHKVNAMEVEIDEACVQILARRQPAASDLRLVVAIIKTITDLERIGDQAEKLGRLELELTDEGASTSQFIKLEHLGNLVSKMLHDALDAFARMNDTDARETIRLDPKVDIEYEALQRQLITHMMEDPRSIKSAMRVSWCARALERIADHAANISEYVIFLVQGKDVRHLEYDDLK